VVPGPGKIMMDATPRKLEVCRSRLAAKCPRIPKLPGALNPEASPHATGRLLVLGAGGSRFRVRIPSAEGVKIRKYRDSH
jgi:hypothetical protein